MNSIILAIGLFDVLQIQLQQSKLLFHRKDRRIDLDPVPDIADPNIFILSIWIVVESF